jgi:hypothetical protein
MSTTDPTAVFPEIPEEGGWIAPWLASLVESVEEGESPYLYILEVT